MVNSYVTKLLTQWANTSQAIKYYRHVLSQAKATGDSGMAQTIESYLGGLESALSQIEHALDEAEQPYGEDPEFIEFPTQTQIDDWHLIYIEYYLEPDDEEQLPYEKQIEPGE